MIAQQRGEHDHTELEPGPAPAPLRCDATAGAVVLAEEGGGEDSKMGSIAVSSTLFGEKM